MGGGGRTVHGECAHGALGDWVAWERKIRAEGLHADLPFSLVLALKQ